MRKDEVIMVTMDSVPGYEKFAVQTKIHWSGSMGSIQKAFDQLQEWAAENQFHAVVGIRILATEIVSQQSTYNPVQSESWYLVYGTCIRYRQ
jgi:hypothetical protein